MKYLPPQLGPHSVTYKDGRYWVVEVANGFNFDGVSKEDADFVLWDGLYGISIGKIIYSNSNKYVGEVIMVHWKMGKTRFETMKEAVAGLAEEFELTCEVEF